MYRDRTVPDMGNDACEAKRVSNVEESLDCLRGSVGSLEDLIAGLTARLALVLSSTSVPHPSNDKAPAYKAPAYGVPLADAMQQLTGRIAALSDRVHDLHDRLGV